MANHSVYKKTLSGSIGAGLGSVFTPKGKTYYILEHRVGSRYHKAGENQEIIVDNIELGRDSHCQVRFDESFGTVSRHHAAIVRDGDNWKLVQLSKTNSTFLNGHSIKSEWYLQNGDEIQLSVNGPKLGFIIPTGNKSTIGSIGLSRRLSLFRQQALRPYKTAIASLSVVLVLAIGGLVAWNVVEHNRWEENKQQLIANLDVAMKAAEKAQEDADKAQKDADKARIEAEKWKDKAVKAFAKLPPDISKLMDEVKSSVYFIINEGYYLHPSGKQIKVMESSSTGFLLDDGRFVTARHCVELLNYGSEVDTANNYNCFNWLITEGGVGQMSYIIHAFNMDGGEFTFRGSDFNLVQTDDEIVDGIVPNLEKAQNPNAIPYFAGKIQLARSFTNDWAYIQTNKRGRIKADEQLSTSLSAGSKVYIWGFPGGMGVVDRTTEYPNPIFGEMTVARDGLSNEALITVSHGVAQGNSGGPVFAIKDNQLYAVGIVSSLNLINADFSFNQQFDNIVPLANLE